MLGLRCRRNTLQYTRYEERWNTETYSGIETNGTKRLWAPGENRERYSAHIANRNFVTSTILRAKVFSQLKLMFILYILFDGKIPEDILKKPETYGTIS